MGAFEFRFDTGGQMLTIMTMMDNLGDGYDMVMMMVMMLKTMTAIESGEQLSQEVLPWSRYVRCYWHCTS